MRVVRALPALERVDVPRLDSLGPDKRALMLAFAVSDAGALAFTAGYDSAGHMVTLLDTSGARVVRMLKAGPGPEELDGLVGLAVREPGVLVFEWNAVGGRFLEYDTAGRLIRVTTRHTPPGAPVRAGRDSVDILVTGASEESLRLEMRSIARSPIEEGVHRTMLEATDSSYRVLARYGERRLQLPLAASTDEIIVLANPYTYQFQSYSAEGRPIARWGRAVPLRFRSDAQVDAMVEDTRTMGPDGRRRPERRGAREEYATTPRMHFTAMQFDAEGRLWTFGAGDDEMAFADVFAETAYLGRISLGCPMSLQKFALSGRWLAALCASTRNDRDVELRLFRIRG